MQLVKIEQEFETNPYLTAPIQEELLYTLPFKDFDKDGYEVPSPLEHYHYIENWVPLNREVQFHIAPVKPWYEDLENSEFGLVLDHCMLLSRWAFAGEARANIQKAAQERPILNKLLSIRPKWGIDFSLDFVDHDICMEVIHIEQDFTDVNEAIAAKTKLEHIIDSTDWEQGVKDLLACKHNWKDLSSDDQSDYKAQFFGWHRAFDNRKVFSS